MKILQILPELNVGGVETGTIDFAKYLIAHGHPAIVVSNGGTLVPELEKAGAKHYALPVHKKSIGTILSCIHRLKKIIKDERIDIVHARSRVPAWIAFFACRGTAAEFITTCHGYYSIHFLSRVMGLPKLVIVPSQVIGQHMVKHFKVDPLDLRLIPRSVDLEKFHFPRKEKNAQGPFVISMIGRITPLKGHIYFLKAMSKVIRTLPMIKIWIIGDVPEKKESYKRELETLVRRLGLKESVEFLGNRKDIPQLLSQTDVLVLSTITQEAFGRVILEAQAAGVPVVATRVGGVVEIIDDEQTGILVEPRDPDRMAEQVIRLLRDPKLVERLTTNAQKKLLANFTLKQMAEQTLKVYQELLNSCRILVIKLSSIGDVILITSSLKAIRKKFSNAKIYCLVGTGAQDILQRCPDLDGLIVFDSHAADRGWRGLWSCSKRLRQYKFDKIIDFQNSRKSHLLSLLSFPRESYGYDRKWGFLLSHRIKDIDKNMAPVQHQFQILKLLDIPWNPEIPLQLWPSKKDHEYAKGLLDSEWLGNVNNVVGINIAASRKWGTKNWPIERIARLCDLLSAKSIRVMITGMDKDQEITHKLLKLTKTKPAIFVGKTDILQLAALIKRCKVFVTPDSAPMHIAAAMKIPFVALFGPTDPARHAPHALKNEIIKKNLPCSPCYSSSCRIKTHDCMQTITAEEVLSKIEKLMAQQISSEPMK